MIAMLDLATSELETAGLSAAPGQRSPARPYSVRPDSAPSAPVSLVDLADRNNLSRQYLEKLFTRLRNAGLVTGTRGPGGGYRLARPPQQISVGEVLSAVDRVDATNCGGRRNCSAGAACLGHSLWARLNENVMGFLDGITLDQVARDVRSDRAQRPEQLHFVEAV